jgi:hypothetical protein
MSRIQCPSCHFAFEDGRPAGLEGLRGRLLYGPERLIVNAHLNAAALDSCPSCGRQFASAPFSMLGEFVRARIGLMGAVYALVALAAIAVVVAIR